MSIIFAALGILPPFVFLAGPQTSFVSRDIFLFFCANLSTAALTQAAQYQSDSGMEESAGTRHSSITLNEIAQQNTCRIWTLGEEAFRHLRKMKCPSHHRR